MRRLSVVDENAWSNSVGCEGTTLSWRLHDSEGCKNYERRDVMDQKDAPNKREPIKPVSKQRADGQKSGLAGEFFVAAELLKRGLQTSLTLGNAKSQ